jgi:signal transduction histidine kinase/ActR/RegA family two-component response regulator
MLKSHTVDDGKSNIFQRLSPLEIDNLIARHIGSVENIGVAVLTAEHRHIYFDDNYTEIFGFSAKTANLNKRLDRRLKYLTKLSQSNTSDGFDDVETLNTKLNEGASKRETGQIQTKNGRAIQIKTVFTNDGYLVLSLKDITRESRQEKLLDIAMDTGRAGYWVYSFETGKFTFSESVRKRLSEVERQRIDRSGLWAIINQQDLPAMMEAWNTAMQSDAPLDLTYRVTTDKDGEMWQRSIGKVQYSSGGKRTHVIAFVRDITADVHRQNQLVSAQKTSQAKSDFMARMSHEIKTPLNAIVGMTDALKDEKLSEDALDTLQIIEEAAENLNTLLTHTLDQAKLDSDRVKVEMVPGSLRDIVENTCSLWRPLCVGKGVDLYLEIDSNLPKTLLVDSFRLQQCLNNLISNAHKFTESGQVSVLVRYLKHETNNRFAIFVRDTGIGMTEEQLEKVFKPYEQADTSITRKFGGTGLGLSISKQLVELMGGNITLKSVSNIGTAFAITLPATEPGDRLKEVGIGSGSNDRILPSLAFETENKKDEPFSGLSILCVEDNPTNQAVVKKLIGKKVENLMFADNGREALVHLENKHFDAILMDIHMPVMNGIETTLEIRNSEAPWANVVIIALTADSEYHQKRICRNLGMNDSIAKPVKRQDILDAFDRTLRKISKSSGQAVALPAA